MARKGWYDREEVGRVTLDWVKLNCKNVTDREMDLLNIVKERKLVRRDHLEIICEGYRNISDSSRTKVINRSINKLFHTMCLDKFNEKTKAGAGNLPCVVAVDKAGSVLLDQPHKQRIQHEKKVYKGKEYTFRKLPPNWKHIHMVNETEVKTIQFCNKHGFDLRWRLEEHNYYKFYKTENGVSKEHLVIPDVLMGIKSDKRIILSWLEIDTGSEDSRNSKTFPTLYEKLRKYKNFRSATSVWEKEFRRFPSLLFVTSDRKRIDYVKRTMNEMNLVGEAIHEDDYESFLAGLFN